MRFLESPRAGPAAVKGAHVPRAPLIGIAYRPWLPDGLARDDALVDYVEIPFELLHHDPSAGAIQESIPAILHCASMSMAGFVPPDEATLAAIEHEASRTRTPWIGEHLAFLTADGITAGE